MLYLLSYVGAVGRILVTSLRGRQILAGPRSESLIWRMPLRWRAADTPHVMLKLWAADADDDREALLSNGYAIWAIAVPQLIARNRSAEVEGW